MKVLLADDNQERADLVSRRLAESGVSQIVRPALGQRLVDAVKAEAPDVLIIGIAAEVIEEAGEETT